MIEPAHHCLSIAAQCRLLSISRNRGAEAALRGWGMKG